jgi:hypothetical protein
MKLLFTYLILICIPRFANAQFITVTGSWNPSVSNTQISEAGLNYTGSTSSLSNQVLIRVMRSTSFFSGLLTWRVDVSKSDINWNNNLVLSNVRTGNGTFQSTFFSSGISGGTTFQTITNANTPFFNGNGNITNIPIQFQLSGYSLLIPAGTYSTNVIYTLIAL